MRTRVLLVDDERLVRVGLRAILTAAGDIEVAGEAGDGIEALELARSARFDVALVDVRMPRLDGIATTRRLRALPDSPAVVMLTSFDLDRYVYDALHAGACGFLLKDAPEDRLLAAVRTAREGVALLDSRVTVRMVERFAPRPPVASPALRRLTPRELTLLLELASGASNAAIGSRLHISEATVKTHVSRILAKLGLETRVQAVVLAYESGLVSRAAEPGAH
jgi:DNA-binding NarL/FixJ family response regulator